MFANLRRWIRGVPPGHAEATFQPAQPPEQREKKYWTEDEINAFGDADEMLFAGVVTHWRADPHGTRWYASDREALSWWAGIQND